MADVFKTLQNPRYGDCEDVDKMLMLVVKRRRTIPEVCMEIDKEMSTYDLSRLENIKVLAEEHEERENFRKIIQGFKKVDSLNFTFEDINETENKLEKYYNKTKELNFYLEGRRKYVM